MDFLFSVLHRRTSESTMYNLSQAFFVMICLIAFSTCLPSTPDSRALSNHAHQPRSDDDLYTAADPHCSSGTTSKNKKRQITCPNPDAAKTKNVPPAEPDQRSDQHADPQPEPQGPAIPWRPRKDKYKGCDHHLLCGRGLRLDDQHQGLLVENLYLCRHPFLLTLQLNPITQMSRIDS